MGFKNLDRVTFTGADDSVKAEEILSLAKRYPQTEWGILFGGPADGINRFPSNKWILTELPKLEGLNLCAHLCGQFVNDLVLRGDFTWWYVYEDIRKLFKRAQINFHGQGYIHQASPAFVHRLIEEPYQFIFQLDGVNDNLLTVSQVLKPNSVGLYDVSHGAGKLPKSDTGNPWPKRENVKEFRGYSGGLGPVNIQYQLPLIDEAAGNGKYWIDMETKVRSKQDQVFDLNKVEEVCDRIWGEVSETD